MPRPQRIPSARKHPVKLYAPRLRAESPLDVDPAGGDAWEEATALPDLRFKGGLTAAALGHAAWPVAQATEGYAP
jgi:hypothetical protein